MVRATKWEDASPVVSWFAGDAELLVVATQRDTPTDTTVNHIQEANQGLIGGAGAAMEQTRKRKNETRRKFTITNTILSNNGKNEKREYNAREAKRR